MIHPIDKARAIERFESVPRLSLGHYPTPIEKMPRLRDALGGGPRLYIKRDDYTGAGLGGNKVRKLEYVLAAAQKDGVDCVITCGGVRSNHCRATAMLAAKLGMECVLVLNSPPQPYPARPANLAVDEWCGARVVLVAGREERVAAMENEARSGGRRAVMIPVGASTPLGAMGYVAAASELAAQTHARELHFDAIFVASSSGGTQAGLTSGLQLFLPANTQLIGVSPDDSSLSIGTTVRGIVSGIGEILGIEFETDVTVLDGFIGPGYGVESDAGREAFALASRTEGLLLDPVYTAKAMAALISQVRAGVFPASSNILFWHTGGQMALFHG